jgi:hypothetical protein
MLVPPAGVGVLTDAFAIPFRLAGESYDLLKILTSFFVPLHDRRSGVPGTYDSYVAVRME